MNRFPFYILLLPIFFFLHGLGENYVPVLVKTAVLLSLVYAMIGFLLASLAWLFFRNWHKAALVAFVIMSFNFFFGSAHDYLKKNLHDNFFNTYGFILPFAGIILLLLVIFLKRNKKPFIKATRFLNWLLVVLIILDLAMLMPKVFNYQPAQAADLSEVLAVCDSCSRPDIYLVVADEYAGEEALRDLCSFDNTPFYTALETRGFNVIRRPRSNYNATVYSMASMLSMDYIKGLESQVVNHRDMLRCRNLVKDNNTTHYLEKLGYRFYNHSFFELDDKEKLVSIPFYPTNTALFTAQTFTSRFAKNLGFHFASRKRLEDIVKRHLYNNVTIDSITRQVAKEKTKEPKFVYAHFTLPHHPYYFDSSGKEMPFELLAVDNKHDRKAYTSYLQYANSKLLDLVDHIKKNASRPPIIILMSDHGFRQWSPEVPQAYYFMNIMAVQLPGGNYNGFYDGMSNVNLFRMLLNNSFAQRLQALPDSTSYYEEPLKDF